MVVALVFVVVVVGVVAIFIILITTIAVVVVIVVAIIVIRIVLSIVIKCKKKVLLFSFSNLEFRISLIGHYFFAMKNSCFFVIKETERFVLFFSNALKNSKDLTQKTISTKTQGGGERWIVLNNNIRRRELLNK